MIQYKTILNIIDNSGIQTAQCIRVLGGYKKKYAYIGDLILISIKNIKSKLYRIKTDKKVVLKAIIVQTKYNNSNKTGIILKFRQNSAILIDKQNNPLVTRIKGFIPDSLKIKFHKLVTISLNFI